MVGVIKKAVLKHQPTCFYAFWRPALVKNKSFLHPKALWSIGGEDWLVGSGCFPVTWSSCPVWTSTIGVFPVSWAKEKPLALPKQGFSCTGKQNNNGKENDASRYPKLGYQKSNFFCTKAARKSKSFHWNYEQYPTWKTWKHIFVEKNELSTWKFPWIEFVDIHVRYYNDFQIRRWDFLSQIMNDKLLVCWMKPEPWKEFRTAHGPSIHWDSIGRLKLLFFYSDNGLSWNHHSNNNCCYMIVGFWSLFCLVIHFISSSFFTSN